MAGGDDNPDTDFDDFMEGMDRSARDAYSTDEVVHNPDDTGHVATQWQTSNATMWSEQREEINNTESAPEESSSAEVSNKISAEDIKEIHFSNNIYRVIRKIGGGGMSVIYAVEDRAGNRKAAKLTKDDFVDREDLESVMTQKLGNEGRVLRASNNCDNIVTLLDGGEATVVLNNDEKGKRNVLIMELLEGMPMDRFIHYFHLRRADEEGARSRSIPSIILTAILRELAFGLEYMNHRPIKYDVSTTVTPQNDGSFKSVETYRTCTGFVHRDIKPENTVMTNSGRPVIIDFDGALAFDDPENADNQPVHGTVVYMSPQAFNQQKLGSRDDVFNLCATMQEAAVGFTLNTVPAPGSHLNIFLQSGVLQNEGYNTRNQPISLDNIAYNIDPEFAYLVNAGLHHDYDQRISAEDLVKNSTALLKARGVDHPRALIGCYLNFIRGMPADQSLILKFAKEMNEDYELKPAAKEVFNNDLNPFWHNHVPSK